MLAPVRFLLAVSLFSLVACSEGSTPANSVLDDAGADEDDDTADDDPTNGGSGNGGSSNGGSGNSGSGNGGESPDDAEGGSSGMGSSVNPSPANCEPGASAFGAPTPSPLISVGAPIVASEGVVNADGLVDGDYHNSATTTNFGSPTEDAPAWVAIDLGVGPSRVLAIWNDPGFSAYNVPSGGAPASYRIDTSSDSSDGIDGTWTEGVVVVDDNAVRSRGHAVEFDGQRWLRFVATGVHPDSIAGLVTLDELAVHDISNAEDGMADAWLFLGDSITYGAFKRDFDESLVFDQQLSMLAPDYYPAFINGAIGGETLGNALDRIDEALELNPDFRYFTIAYGTNDAWGNKSVASAAFETRLIELVEIILDAGHVPVIARIPFADAAHDTLPEFNDVIDRLTREYELPCGPDLYTLFWENPRYLGDDLVHPIQRGNIEINRAWAEAAAAHYSAN